MPDASASGGSEGSGLSFWELSSLAHSLGWLLPSPASVQGAAFSFSLCKDDFKIVPLLGLPWQSGG